MKRILLLTLIVTGCDREVSRIQINTWQETKAVSCVVSAYDCSTIVLMPDGNGGLNPMDIAQTCYNYGSQWADVETKQYRSRYKSGKFLDWTKEEVVATRSACQ